MSKTNKEPIISVNSVSVTFKSRRGFFRYSPHQSLVDVSFELFPGETLGVVGRNGCGKSTLLKVLSGIYHADKGSVDSKTDRISLQTLTAGFDNQLNGADNALLSAMFLGMSKDEALNSLENVKEFSELGEAFHDPVKTYSSGMKARLGFSTAILMDVDVLLIDESLGVGDVSFKKKAESTIVKKMKSDQTVVFVSHSSGQIRRLCHRVLWLEEGKVVALGDTNEVVDKYEEFMEQRRKADKKRGKALSTKYRHALK